MTLFVTGPRGAGKTTFCELLFWHLRVEARIDPGGTRSLALLSHRASRNEGYDLEIREDSGPSPGAAAPRSQVLPLARDSKAAPEWTGGNLGPWIFSQNAFDRARTSFDSALPGLERGGLFVLDEVGPLELKLGRGYASLLPRAAALPRLVTVIRPGLVDSLRTELARLAGTAQTTEPGSRVTLLEIEPKILDDQTERRRLLRHAEEALT